MRASVPTATSSTAAGTAVGRTTLDLGDGVTLQVASASFVPGSTPAGKAAKRRAPGDGGLGQERRDQITDEGDPDCWDQWFGLLNHGGTPKSAVTRWSAGLAAADRARTTRRVKSVSSTGASAASVAAAEALKVRKARAAARAASRARSRTLAAATA